MGVLDKFLDAIKLNDEDEEYLDDDILDDEDEFLEDEEPGEKPHRRFLGKFGSKKAAAKAEDDYDDEFDELEEDDFEEEEEPEPTPRRPVTSASSGSRVSSVKPRPSAAPRTTSPSKPSAPVRPSVSSRDDRSERSSRQSASSKITPMRQSRRSNAENVEVCVIRTMSMENTREIADTLLEGSTVILNLEGIDVELAQRIIDFASGSCYSLEGTLQKVSSYIFVLGPSNVDITGDLPNLLGGSAPSISAGY